MQLPNPSGTTTLGRREPSDDREHSEARRDFVKTLATTTVALGVGGAVVECGRFLEPNVLYEPSKVFKVGALANIPIGSRTVIEGRGIAVVRERDGVHAISLVCTHLGCLIRPVENDAECGYACPCHGSRFTMAGEVLDGPAPRDLPWYEVYVDLAGDLVVDTSRVNEQHTKLAV